MKEILELMHQKTHIATKDRFDMEQDILKLWEIGEDMKSLTQMYMDGREPMSTDELWSKLDAIHHIHDLRMNRLWDTYLQVLELDGYYNPNKADEAPSEKPKAKAKRKTAKSGS